MRRVLQDRQARPGRLGDAIDFGIGGDSTSSPYSSRTDVEHLLAEPGARVVHGGDHAADLELGLVNMRTSSMVSSNCPTPRAGERLALQRDQHLATPR